MNNTPIVAMLTSVVEAWAARCGLSQRVLMMPLSFASLLGGMCTLIGSSSNMVLDAQIRSDSAAEAPPPFSMFAMTPVALPSAAVGIITLCIAAPRVLQKKPPAAPAASPATFAGGLNLDGASYGSSDAEMGDAGSRGARTTALQVSLHHTYLRRLLTRLPRRGSDGRPVVPPRCDATV